MTIRVFGVMLIITGVFASSIHAKLADPVSGWAAEYNATGGKFPSQSSPHWVNYYKSKMVEIISDAASDKKVLHLDNSKGGNFENQYYQIKSPDPSTISIGSRMTMEYRVRLTDKDEPRPQLTVILTCPVPGSNIHHSYLVRLMLDGIFYDTGVGYPKYRYNIGTKWHTVRLVVDTGIDKADLYIDGILVLNSIRGVRTEQMCGIKLGDGSSWVRGGADIVYIRWTDNETVPVIKEETSSAYSLSVMRKEREQIAHKKRCIIMNSDNGDMHLNGIIRLIYTPHSAATEKDFLDSRYTGLKDSQVDTIFYNWTPPKELLNFDNFTWLDIADAIQEYSKIMKKGKVPIDWDAVRKTTELWHNALDILADFGHSNSKEVFWTCRMNDTHDSSMPELFNQWKQDHPDCLMGKKGDKIPYGGHRWSAVNYEKNEVRAKMYQTIKDVCTEHDIDGIEMDFYRHPIYFKTAAFGKPVTDAQRTIMTGFIRKVRAMTEQVSVAGKRPLLIAIRIPGSVEYCKAIGLDVEKWLKDGLIDMVTVGGYHHFRPWKESVEWGHKYNVPVYACISASLIGYKMSDWRGEALQAWKAGIDGIYIFNIFNPYAIQFRELGSVKTIKGTDKNYRTRWHGWYTSDSGYWLKDGEKYAWIVRFNSTEKMFDKPFKLRMTFPDKDMEIHYTLDGNMPTKSSPLYTAPLSIEKTTTVRVAAFDENGDMASLYDTRAEFSRADAIYKPESKLPLKMFGFPVGTTKEIQVKLPADGIETASIYLTMDDVDSKREVKVFINGKGPLELPDKILNPSGISSALWNIPSGILHAGNNIFTFTFADNLNNATSGFAVDKLEVIYNIHKKRSN